MWNDEIDELARILLVVKARYIENRSTALKTAQRGLTDVIKLLKRAGRGAVPVGAITEQEEKELQEEDRNDEERIQEATEGVTLDTDVANGPGGFGVYGELDASTPDEGPLAADVEESE